MSLMANKKWHYNAEIKADTPEKSLGQSIQCTFLLIKYALITVKYPL